MLFSLIVLVATGILITSFTVIQTLFCDGKGTQFEKLYFSESDLKKIIKKNRMSAKSESLLDQSEFHKDVAWLNMEANQNL